MLIRRLMVRWLTLLHRRRPAHSKMILLRPLSEVRSKARPPSTLSWRPCQPRSKLPPSLSSAAARAKSRCGMSSFVQVGWTCRVSDWVGGRSPTWARAARSRAMLSWAAPEGSPEVRTKVPRSARTSTETHGRGASWRRNPKFESAWEAQPWVNACSMASIQLWMHRMCTSWMRSA